jgi:hypothetical protein
MAGTAAVAAKKALFDALAAKAVTGQPLEGVQVAYSFPGKTLQRECIYFGRTRIDQSFSTFASPSVGGGRQPRTEIATQTIVVLASNIKSDQYAADLRVVAIGTVMEEILAADPTGGGAVQVRAVESGDLEQMFDDDGVWSQLTYSATVRSELV